MITVHRHDEPARTRSILLMFHLVRVDVPDVSFFVLRLFGVPIGINAYIRKNGRFYIGMPHTNHRGNVCLGTALPVAMTFRMSPVQAYWNSYFDDRRFLPITYAPVRYPRLLTIVRPAIGIIMFVLLCAGVLIPLFVSLTR